MKRMYDDAYMLTCINPLMPGGNRKVTHTHT